ncbi:MAG: HD domain-containing protein, partial [Eggerthellaceae bacterium]|nr:HD domain-containing protein [Eggerthellaceae bacterium]
YYLSLFGIDIPPFVQKALRALEAANHEAWLVGGCVRDALLERQVHDYDIATSARWQDAESALSTSGFAIHRTGTAHGTVTASLDGNAIEVTTYRTDGAYTDGRHPDSVTFVRTIEEDLARRDFTINAMAYHPDRGLLDTWNGQSDLETHTIRVVGDASKRFAEDSLRVLRGCRFASQLGFTIEPTTLAAMKKEKTGLLRVSAERITHEMDELLLGDFVHDALMETVDVLVAFMPEIAACRGFDQRTPYHIYDVWEHTAWVVQHSPKTRLARWVALFHDIGKPAAFYTDANGRGHFFKHQQLSAILAKSIMERLLMSPAFTAQVLALVSIHDRQVAANPRSVKRALSNLGGDVDLFRTLCGVKRADALAQSELSEPRLKLSYELECVLDEVIASSDAFSLKQLAIDGNDVLELGVPAGPRIGELLDAALDAVIEEQLPNERETLIAFLKTQR